MVKYIKKEFFMKRILCLVLILSLLILPSCSSDAEIKDFGSYEFSTDELNSKVFDELTITYPAYMDVILDSPSLNYDSEGDFQAEYFNEDTLDYLWFSLLTAYIEEDFRVTDIKEIEMKLLVMDSEEEMELIDFGYYTIGGKEAMFAAYDYKDEYYDEYDTQFWMVGIYDYDKNVLFSFNFDCDKGIYRQDAYAVLSNLEFK